MNFGKYAVISPHTYNFEKEPDWYWKFQPPTARNELDLQSFLFHKRTRTSNGVAEAFPATAMEVVFRQLALTFGGTNIPEFEKNADGEWIDSGKPILKDNAKPEAVEAVLGLMPTELVQELWVALGEHVPNWGPMKNAPKDQSLV